MQCLYIFKNYFQIVVDSGHLPAHGSLKFFPPQTTPRNDDLWFFEFKPASDHKEKDDFLIW